MDGTGQSPAAKNGRPPRPVIGALIDNVDDDFQRSIWAGLEAAAKEGGASLVSLVGGNLDPGELQMVKRNRIWGLISPKSVDGVVVVSTTLATHLGAAALEEHCRHYAPLPMVSVGFPLASMTSVISEGQLGMRDLLDHLIVRHGRKRLMFIGGTPRNPDTVERERIFRETLKHHGIAIDPRLVRQGDFRPDRVYAAVRQVHGQGLDFDAVVAANDDMAIAAMDACVDAGLRIPEDVSITGFDDIPSAQRQRLPLTTVRQPTVELARRAVQLLLGILKGDPAPEEERHPTQIVIRRSCGCFSETALRAAEPRHGKRSNATTPFPHLTETIMAVLKKESGALLRPRGPEGIAGIVQAFVAEVGGGPGSFASRLDTELRESLAQGTSDEVWDDFLSLLRRETGGRLAPAAEVRSEALLHQARILVREASRQQLWKAHARLSRKMLTLQYVIDSLIGCFDTSALLDTMARELPRIGIRRCYLSVHSSPASAFDKARLLLAYDQAGRKNIDRHGIEYPAKDLLPPGILDRSERTSLVYQPLIFGEEEIGFIGLEFSPQEEISSLALAEQIRSALKASMIMQELLEKDRLLSKLHR
jgi:DNA-binding LacI/PurR family transcriptional regulator